VLSQVEITAEREAVKPLSWFTAYTEAVKEVTCIHYLQITIKVTVFQMDILKFIMNSKKIESKGLVSILDELEKRSVFIIYFLGERREISLNIEFIVPMR
jgi:hypothetical protein